MGTRERFTTRLNSLVKLQHLAGQILAAKFYWQNISGIKQALRKEAADIEWGKFIGNFNGMGLNMSGVTFEHGGARIKTSMNN